MPLPYPRAIGTLPVIAVIGAAFATAMNSTPASPTAPTFSLLWWSASGTGLLSGACAPPGVLSLVVTCLSMRLGAESDRLEQTD
jgi:hypothetical protein